MTGSGAAIAPVGAGGYSLKVNAGGVTVQWTKPEFEIVEVTMEVTAYVARR